MVSKIGFSRVKMSRYVMIACLILALIAALGYILMITGVIEPGNLLEDDEPMSSALWIIPAGYVIGGLLIFLKQRWLWITGAIINGFGIIVFYVTYAGHPDVLWSAPGLITKIAQIPLEIGLLYLIATAYKAKTAAK